MTYITNKDPQLEIAQNKVADKRHRALGGNNNFLNANKEESIWDQGGLLTITDTNKTLYASSSSSSDVGVNLVILGWDDNLETAFRLVTTNGQNQVALNADLAFISNVALLAGPEPQGDIYIAESDTLIGGVPQTQSKIQAKMIQGNNASYNAVDVASPGTTWFIRVIEYTTGKLNDIDIVINFKPLGESWIKFPLIHLSESPIDISKDIYTRLIEKSIILVNAISRDDGAALSAGIFFDEVDN